jgi:hypothetical protein
MAHGPPDEATAASLAMDIPENPEHPKVQLLYDAARAGAAAAAGGSSSGSSGGSSSSRGGGSSGGAGSGSGRATARSRAAAAAAARASSRTAGTRTSSRTGAAQPEPEAEVCVHLPVHLCAKCTCFVCFLLHSKSLRYILLLQVALAVSSALICLRVQSASQRTSQPKSIALLLHAEANITTNYCTVLSVRPNPTWCVTHFVHLCVVQAG